jgi:trehalose 2-sulfotransferase
MYTQQKLDHEFADGVAPTVSYAVCALPRSGSSLLCELLFSTGCGGAPGEFFDPAMMKRFRERWRTESFGGYLAALRARKTGPNGVFGFKTHFFQLEAAFPGGALEEAFPRLRYVYISRGDRLRQAISWARALQTHKWASEHEVRVRHPEVFRRPQIDKLIAGIEERERRWEGFFTERGVEPLRVTYEQLVAASRQTVAVVLEHVGVDEAAAVHVGTPTLRRQSDELTEEWVRLYRDKGAEAPVTGAV